MTDIGREVRFPHPLPFPPILVFSPANLLATYLIHIWLPVAHLEDGRGREREQKQSERVTGQGLGLTGRVSDAWVGKSEITVMTEYSFIRR